MSELEAECEVESRRRSAVCVLLVPDRTVWRNVNSVCTLGVAPKPAAASL